jgi:hypothetical protein
MLRRTILFMTCLAALAAAAPQAPDARDAMRLGRTQDDALYSAFSKGYHLSPTPPVANAEIVTEFRRAVLIVREHVQRGEIGFTDHELDNEMKPHRGLVTFIVEVNLHPLNTYQRMPSYEMYVSPGSGVPPLAAPAIKRDPIYALGGPGASLLGVRLEATFPHDKIAAGPASELIVTNETADVLWRARIDLSRYR